MAKILYGISGLTGITNASLEVLRRLKLAGYEVLVVAPKDIREIVTSYDFAFEQMPPIDYQPGPPVPKYHGPFRSIRTLWHLWSKRVARRRSAVNNCTPHSFLGLLRRFQPDVLMLDIELHEYILSSWQHQIPIVLISQWFSTWHREGLPPIQSKLIPVPLGSATPKVMAEAWQATLQKRQRTFRKQRWLTVGTDRRSTLLRLAKQANFPVNWIQDNFWPGPITYDNLPVITLAPEALEFPHELRPELHYIGPVVFEQRKQHHNADFAAIQALLAQAKAKQQKLIYCSVSTMQVGDAQLINKVIAAVGTQAAWLAIISLGGKKLEGLPTELPPNVHLFSYVPQLQVLAAADCSINHGGIHTINECLCYEVPMLVYSGEHADQNGCAARVAYHQIGLIGDKKKDSAADIKLNLQKLLSDESYLAKIKAVGSHKTPNIVDLISAYTGTTKHK